MSLEEITLENTVAMRELTKAILGGVQPKTGPPVTGLSKVKPPKATMKEVTDACVAVKTDKGEAVAKALILKVGKASMLKEVQPAQFDALVAACKEALLEPEPELELAEDDTL